MYEDFDFETAEAHIYSRELGDEVYSYDLLCCYPTLKRDDFAECLNVRPDVLDDGGREVFEDLHAILTGKVRCESSVKEMERVSRDCCALDLEFYVDNISWC